MAEKRGAVLGQRTGRTSGPTGGPRAPSVCGRQVDSDAALVRLHNDGDTRKLIRSSVPPPPRPHGRVWVWIRVSRRQTTTPRARGFGIDSISRYGHQPHHPSHPPDGSPPPAADQLGERAGAVHLHDPRADRPRRRPHPRRRPARPPPPRRPRRVRGPRRMDRGAQYSMDMDRVRPPGGCILPIPPPPLA